MSEKEEFVNCRFCGASIDYGWRLERTHDQPTLYLCSDCYALIDGAVRWQFPSHMSGRGMGKFSYFELGGKNK